MGHHRSPKPAAVLVPALAVAWTVVVVLQVVISTGDWISPVRHVLLLGSAAGLLGLAAATVDDLLEDILTGGGRGGRRGRSRRRPAPVRVRPSRQPRRPRGPSPR